MHLTLSCLFARKIYAFRVVVLVYRIKLHISHSTRWCVVIFVFGIDVLICKKKLRISHCYVGLQEKATHLMSLHWFFVLLCWFTRELCISHCCSSSTSWCIGVDASYSGSLLWWNNVFSLNTLYSSACA
jgi:hypothetical protein